MFIVSNLLLYYLKAKTYFLCYNQVLFMYNIYEVFMAKGYAIKNDIQILFFPVDRF